MAPAGCPQGIPRQSAPSGQRSGGSAAVHSGQVIALLGPTGVGKTAVAIALSRRLGVRVISCDSMQMYDGLPLLTNQPSEKERRLAPHELVGTLDPTASCSAVEYAALARPLIDDDLRLRGWALLSGGTGLYMRAALAPLQAAPTDDPDLRRRLESRAANEGPDALHAHLGRLDPEAAARIDPRNVRRVVRALEVVTTKGAAWSGRDDLWKPRYFHRTLVVGLTMERQALHAAIDRRAAAMLAGGAVEEVREHRSLARLAGSEGTATARGSLESLLGSQCRDTSERPGALEDRGLCQAIGYREICRYLDGLQSLDQTIQEVAGATRRYARRQETWLRKVKDAVIIDVQGRSADEISEEILSLARSGSDQQERSTP